MSDILSNLHREAVLMSYYINKESKREGGGREWQTG